MDKQVTRQLDKYITVTVKEEYHLMKIGEVRGTGTKVALLERRTKFEPYIVAWNYDINDGTWGQGHYFESSAQAAQCYINYIQG